MLIVHAARAPRTFQRLVGVHMGHVLNLPAWRIAIVHPGAAGAAGTHIRPQSYGTGGEATERSVGAGWSVGVVAGPGSLLLPADEADQGTAQQEQQGGGPADVDGGAHLSLQGRRHQGVVVDRDGHRCRPADGNQAQDAGQDAESATQQGRLGISDFHDFSFGRAQGRSEQAAQRAPSIPSTLEAAYCYEITETEMIFQWTHSAIFYIIFI